MEYLLKVSAVVAIFHISYKLFLQRDTFFESNRWFLIIGLISSLIIPFLVIPIYIEYTPIDLSNFTINEQVSTEIVEKPFNILDYLPLIYGLGVAYFSLRFFINLMSLAKLIYKNKGFKKENFVFIETQNNTSPFSFFNWIVYNPEKFIESELEHIIEHEKTHAKQYHSLDILINQLFCILLWFNPFIWFYNKDLKQNLEFIADKKTIKEYNCKKSYQYTLLKTSMPSHQMALSNNFYNSLIKKRIVMLHKSKSKKINQLKYALVLPLLALFLINCNSETTDTNINEELNSKPENKIGFKINATGTKEGKLPLYLMDGKEISSEEMVNLDPNSIKSIDVLKDKAATSVYGDRGKDGVVILTSNGEPKFIERKTMTGIKVTGYDSKSNGIAIRAKTLRGLTSGDGASPLIIVDGKEVSNKKLEDINPENVESMNVLKGETATKKYGEKAKNGVIEVTTKK